MKLLRSKLIWLLAITGIGVTAFVLYAGKPSQGVVHQNLSAEEIKKLEEEKGNTLAKKNQLENLYTAAKEEETRKSASPNQYKGTYFSFSYPYGYSIKQHDTDKGTILDRTMISTQDTFSKRFIMTLEQTTATSYDDIPSITLRRTKRDTYTEMPISLNGRSGIAFEAIDEGYEKAAFFLTGNRLTTIVFVSSANADSNNEFDRIVKTFEWK